MFMFQLNWYFEIIIQVCGGKGRNHFANVSSQKKNYKNE